MNARALLFTALALAGAGACMSTSSFTSARTLEPGDVKHTVGLNAYALNRDDEIQVQPVPMPLYGVSFGLIDQLEFGGTVAIPGLLKLELKYNPLRSEYFDLAIAPNVFVAVFPTTTGQDDSSMLVGAELPLVFNLNASRSFSLIGWTGPAYGGVPALGVGAPYIRAGLGFQSRFKGWSIQPDFSVAWDPERSEVIDVALGFGVALGDLPKY